ncbi:hypothetical protein [Erythrobacter litoralis]|uniref:Bacterial dipeptidyl-peptidase SH3 domain-containing protein n=1 Tax=Erythrobacter litoralis (strain HTCC2594) TaxID=314225 RepID=Q2ND14_ERYLH|nr:hypothetical protein [Erythrobacter litoralis]ABC62427.1 hypothetical protein ELI_01675 [Erythrobacter litoralis HTCC2594]
MSENATYPIPEGDLSLSGPVVRPAPGTLPIRGDVAHIALADRFLVPHYVVPKPVAVVRGPADLHLAMDTESEVLHVLQEGDGFEALDVSDNWVWGACGPEGPSGYVTRTAFDI